MPDIRRRAAALGRIAIVGRGLTDSGAMLGAGAWAVHRRAPTRDGSGGLDGDALAAGHAPVAGDGPGPRAPGRTPRAAPESGSDAVAEAEAAGTAMVPSREIGRHGTEWYVAGDPIHFDDRGAGRYAAGLVADVAGLRRAVTGQ